MLGVDPQRRLPAAGADDVGEVGLVLAHVVGELGPVRRAGRAAPARRPRRQVSVTNGCSSSSSNRSACTRPSAVDAVERVLEAARPGVAEVEPAVLVAAERAGPVSGPLAHGRAGGDDPPARCAGSAAGRTCRPPTRTPRRSARASARGAPRG